MKIQQKKLLLFVFLGIVVVVLLITVAYVLFKSNKKASSISLLPDGKYAMLMMSEGKYNDATFTLNFDAQHTTYEEVIGANKQEVTLESGTFSGHGKQITTTSKDKLTENYILYGNHLMPKELFFTGKIPQGKTFETVCSLKSKDGQADEITFKSDGSYSEITSAASTETASYGTEKQVSTNGTYVRKGNFIQRKSKDGNKLIDFYIYRGSIINSYFVCQNRNE